VTSRPTTPAARLRRLAAATFAVLAVACGGGGDGPTPPDPSADVAAVRVTLEGGAALGAQPLTLRVGQTLDLAATVHDAAGAALTRAVAWTSSPTSVAGVDAASGVVTAAAPGEARIVAAAGGRETAVTVKVEAAPTLPTPAPTPVPLTVTLAGVGSVASTPAGIDCRAAGAPGCTASFAPGAGVTLTATPDANSTFAGWTGGCTGTGPCTVTVGQTASVTATFAARRVGLTVTRGGAGTGDVLVTGGNVAPANTPCTAATCSYTVDAGAAVNLTARPASGSVAGEWTGACTGPATQACPLNLTADATAGVTFAPPPVPDSVSVAATSTQAGVELRGTVRVTGLVNGQPRGSAFEFVLTTSTPLAPLAFDQGSPIIVEFEPNAQARLVSWGGACAGSEVVATGRSTCRFNATRNSQVTVSLAPR
jgi:hypothetical protein